MSRSDDLEQRLSFLNLRDADRQLLADLKPAFEKHAESFVASFYRHLLSFGTTRELLRDPEVKERLLAKQREYLLTLTHPGLDEEYVEQRKRIGEAHDRAGLGPGWYLGAYGLYLSLMAPVIYEESPDDARRVADSIVALGKLLILDAEIAMESYIERQNRELAFLTEELAKEGRQLARDFAVQSAELAETEHRARAAEELASVATLVAGLAHEVGTPMGVIQGHAKLLERAVEGEEARWRLETIQEQISRISKIIQTLLNMARTRKTRRLPVVLAPLIEGSLGFVSEKLSRRKIRVTQSLDEVPSISGDSERLQQMFLNLFLNAADAMPDGGTLSVVLRQPTPSVVEIRVRDTGIGIRPEDLERVFDPFFTTKEAGVGNGLGLMVSKGIVSDHGGTIDVTSEGGSGTEFRIVLPVAGSGEAAAEAAS